MTCHCSAVKRIYRCARGVPRTFHWGSRLKGQKLRLKAEGFWEVAASPSPEAKVLRRGTVH